MFTGIEVPTGTRLRLATTADLESIKQLDDTVFDGQQGISVEELSALLNYGAIIVLETESGEIIGESQVLAENIPYLHYKLQADEAYYYGTGISLEWQGQGHGRLLAQAQDIFALAQNKNKASLTVLPENGASIKLRLGVGFTIRSYIPEFYEGKDGSGGESKGRVVWAKAY